jgi:hypothetical protein
VWIALMALLGGCGFEREPGPHPEDEGKITYWLVLGSEGTTSQCTDAQSWDALINPPQFDPYTYIIYRVEDGGGEAMGQDCARLSPSSCTDTDQIFEIDGSTLTAQLPDQTVLQQGGCSLILHSHWEIEDKGPDGVFLLPTTFEYVGDEAACATLEAQVIEESPNGFGLENCTTGLVIDLLLDRIVAKAE